MPLDLFPGQDPVRQCLVASSWQIEDEGVGGMKESRPYLSRTVCDRSGQPTQNAAQILFVLYQGEEQPGMPV